MRSSITFLALLTFTAVTVAQELPRPTSVTKPTEAASVQTQHSGPQLGGSATEGPRVLQPGSPKSVPVPPFSPFGGSKCDSSGNLYFAVGGNTHLLGPLLEISHDAAGSTTFSPPMPQQLDPGNEIGYRDFAVTPSGRVYELLQNKNDQGIVVIEFHSDGTAQHTTKPNTPEALQARSLAVFDDGTLLLEGFVRRQPGEDAARDYVALFDASGKLRKELTGFPDVNLALRRTTLQDGGLAIGREGNAYRLDANFISVISESGENVRHIPYQKPDPALVARGLSISDGLVVIRVLQIKGSEITERYLIVRADSGETIGYYALPDETEDFGMCFSRGEGFTFLTREDTKLALVNAPLR
jgi:hypothetical protein